MKTNKDYLLAVRISIQELKMLKRIAKHRGKKIPELIREFISLEDTKLLHDELSQERLFDMSDIEKQNQLERITMSLATLTLNTNNKFSIVESKKESNKRKKGTEKNE